MKKIAKLFCLLTLVTFVAVVVACNEKDPLVEEEKPTNGVTPSVVIPTDTSIVVQFLTGNQMLINTYAGAANPYVQFRVTSADSLQKLVLWRVNNGERSELAQLTTFDNSKDFTKDVTELMPQMFENLDSIVVEAYSSAGYAVAALPVERYTADPLLDASAAFPGAEGFARSTTTGGRGGRIIYVTTLEDNNTEGSLRWACNQTGPRIIMFKVSGIIRLKSGLGISKGDVTIAGQTAPGDGICIAEGQVGVNTSNVIIRYMRFRPGNFTIDGAPITGDGITGRNQKNIILDHCSVSWGSSDETASFYDNENFTMQWCIISESLLTRRFAGLWGGKKASFHHNLLAHHSGRCPRFVGSRYSRRPDLELVDFRNNVTFNWDNASGGGAEGGSHNLVNNYYKPGPETYNSKQVLEAGYDGVSWGKFYVEGNYMLKKDGTPNDSVNDDNWEGVTVDGTINKLTLKSTVEFGKGTVTVTTHTAQKAYELVLANAGASLRRDSTDMRVINETITGIVPKRATGTGSERLAAGLINTHLDVGGWVTYKSQPAPLDTDGDGMPDAWEVANGLDPNSMGDGLAKKFSSVYTNVEVYLSSIVDHITGAQQEF